MLKMARWCIAHRRLVLIAWVAIAAVVTVGAQAAGRNYASNFTLPGTESQRAIDLLTREFPQQSGDVDTFVFHVSSGTVDSPAVRRAMAPVIAKLSGFPHVVNVISPYSSAGAVQVSRDKRTAFATIDYSKRANLLPNDTGKPVIALVKGLHVPGVKVAVGGQVIEQAQGFNIGPATTVGVVAALVILLMTFGSLLAAGIPLVTAGLGLISGVALIGLATHVMQISNVSPDLALMIGLGVGIDYALFIVTRFREDYLESGDVRAAVLEAMDTSGRAILLAGTTVVIALLGMFATGVSFMYGLAVTSSLTVLLTMLASLTLLPAILSKIGGRLVRRPGARRVGRGGAALDPESFAAARAAHTDGRSRWREWSRQVQARPWRLAIASLVVMVVLLTPVFALRLDTSDAGNDPSNTNTRQAFDMLARGFGAGFNGPLLLVAELPKGGSPAAALPALSKLEQTPDVAALAAPRLAPSGGVAVLSVYPRSAPQAPATTDLVNRLRHDVLPPIERSSGVTVLVGGFTAGSIDFSNVLSGKLPLFIALVVVLSALLLLVMFRSVIIALQAAVMNLLSIGGALGATVAVFQWGWLGGLLGVEKGPVEPWIPVLMFAVVFGLSMDYEVFLVSRVREEWVRRRDPSSAVGDGIAFTGRVISAAAAIMIFVFLSFMLGNERTLKEFGFGLAAAVFLDALVVRCVMLPAVLELLGPLTWRLPGWLDARLPHINIEGSSARTSQQRLGESAPA
jgi:RND superfamily putative drug exporter